MSEWQKFLNGREPTPYLVFEFFEIGSVGWGEPLTWLLTEYGYDIEKIKEALDTDGLLRIDD